MRVAEEGRGAVCKGRVCEGEPVPVTVVVEAEEEVDCCGVVWEARTRPASRSQRFQNINDHLKTPYAVERARDVFYVHLNSPRNSPRAQVDRW